jgi:glutathione S-transferase
MQLLYAAASPFARKVRVMASELGLLDAIVLIDSSVLPTRDNPEVSQANPLTKIPVLLTSDAGALYDSRVICEYLDNLHHGERLLPLEPAKRWPVLQLAALADGLMDAALLARYEGSARPAELQWPAWLEGQLSKIERALDHLEQQHARLHGPLDIAQIGVACALGYLDFRFADLAWRDGRPNLAAFYEGFSQRPSMHASKPV